MKTDELIRLLATGADAVDTHDQPAGRVGAGDAGVGLHPIRRMVVPLLSREQRQRRLHGIDAKVLAVGQRELAPAQVKAVAHSHVTGAVALNGLDDHGEVVQFEVILCLHG